ncbi:MAG: winged helix-turn-helix domain-containing protein [Candidatus Bathyarchaeia archaeon]
MEFFLDEQINKLKIEIEKGCEEFEKLREKDVILLMAEEWSSIERGTVINRVLEKMKNKLKPKDLEMLPSGKEIRCVNHVKWEIWRLVNEGYIRKDTPPGIWEITEKGREYYEKLKIKS